MQLNTRPKLLPPLALLAPGPGGLPYPAASRSTLSAAELRRIVAELIG